MHTTDEMLSSGRPIKEVLKQTLTVGDVWNEALGEVPLLNAVGLIANAGHGDFWR